jgi:hypothetical protein
MTQDFLRGMALAASLYALLVVATALSTML